MKSRIDAHVVVDSIELSREYDTRFITSLDRVLFPVSYFDLALNLHRFNERF